MERRELERQIVEKEWLMFQQVQGVNGRAACQDDWTTFLIMRLSQFEGWDTDVLESYFEDIVQAEAQERNLIMEKRKRISNIRISECMEDQQKELG